MVYPKTINRFISKLQTVNIFCIFISWKTGNYYTQRKPSEEICDSKDNDCDGLIDENSDCMTGDMRECGIDVGECRKGVQTCYDCMWGDCEGSTKPAEEICDGKDNDCDGEVENEISCDNEYIIYDPETGLTWQKDTSVFNWNDAESYCDNLVLSGYEDWRLPTRQEYMDFLGGCDDNVSNGDVGFCNSCNGPYSHPDLGGTGIESKKCSSELFQGFSGFCWADNLYCIHLDSGNVIVSHNSNYRDVRCIRTESETSVSGVISSNTVWTIEKSPYIVTDSVLVLEGVTLTIESGVFVKFELNTYLQLKGTIITRGTDNKKIVFTSNQAQKNAGDWKYVYTTDTSPDTIFSEDSSYLDGSIIENCIFEYGGKDKAQLTIENASVLINKSHFSNSSSDGISLDYTSYCLGSVIQVMKFIILDLLL